jgi:hypothetical protein
VIEVGHAGEETKGVTQISVKADPKRVLIDLANELNNQGSVFYLKNGEFSA